jgi:hypothetical protein
MGLRSDSLGLPGSHGRAQNQLFEIIAPMDLMQTIAATPPLMIGVGALLFGVGWGLRYVSYTTPELKRWGARITNYGVMVILLAIALWLMLWFIEAWESGVV